METNKPDIVVMDKKEGKCLIIDIACLFDTKISEKEEENLEKVPGFEEGTQKDLEVQGSHYRACWCPWNGVNQPEEMVTCVERSTSYRYFLKETVVLRRWGSCTQNFCFINEVDNVN